MADRSQVVLVEGDVASQSGDVLVIPSTTAGSFGAPWADLVRDLGGSRPGPIALGTLSLMPLESGGPYRHLAFAATVDDAARGGPRRTSTSTVRRVGSELGRLTADSSIIQIVTPMLGTGAGRLDVEDSLAALAEGFRATASAESTLLVTEIDPDRFTDLDQRAEKILARPVAPMPESVGDTALSSAGATGVADPLGWDGLEDETRTVLRLAEASRRAMDRSQIHMEHLAWALSVAPVSGAPTAWRDARVPQVEEIRGRLGDDYARSLTIPRLDTMPRFSGHAADALRAATRAAGGSPVSVAHVVSGVLAIPTCSVAAWLLEQLGPRGMVLARPTGDTVPAEVAKADRLDLEREIEMMAAVVLARETPLPLAIGLFGDWGSGKSFFMAMMRERIWKLAALSERGRQDAAEFCPRPQIRQIVFNAWHYIDGNLWASLASTIFDGLVDSPDDELKQRRTDDLGQAKKEAIVADENVRKAEDELRSARRAANGLGSIAASAIPAALDAVRTLPDIERQLGDIGVDFDPAVPAEQIVTAVGEATNLSNRARLLWGLVRAETAGQRWRTTGIFVLVAAVLVAAVVWLGWLGAWGPVLAVVTAALAALSPALAATGAIVSRASRARRAREKQVRQAEARLALAQRTRQQAEDDLVARQAELERLRNRGQRLHDLVRSAQSQYRAQLSMMSQLRKDFEQLSLLLDADSPIDGEPRDRKATSSEHLRAAAAKVMTAGDRESTDTLDVRRIVLYIDDLDRCPAQEVVEVLQAINLLLAFPLFVVVIGVDGRWLEASLKARHQDLLESPRDYLEKIIQIPFVLRRLTPDTYSSLIESLIPAGGSRTRREGDGGPGRGVDEQTEDAEDNEDNEDNEDAASAESHGRADDRADEVGGAANRPSPFQEPHPVPVQKPDEATVQEPPPLPVSLVISDDERIWLAKMGEIVSTPRTTKRMVNTYRMLRVCAGNAHSWEFSPRGGREYRAVILLLAVLVGYPERCQGVFGGIATGEAGSSLGTVLRQHLGKSDVDKLLMLEHPGDSFTLATYQRWLPFVRRFDYNLGSRTAIDGATREVAGVATHPTTKSPA